MPQRRHQVLALDFDGTLARNNVVAPETIAALEAWKAVGGKVVLVTGRSLDCFDGNGPSPLCFDRVDLFDRVVCDNGATVYDPAAGAVTFCQMLPAGLADALRARTEIQPLWLGPGMVSSPSTNRALIDAAIAQVGGVLHHEGNRSWSMWMQPGVTKATGLRQALRQIGCRLEQTVGMGDAQNDLSFLRVCGTSIAVGDAQPELKAACDFVATGASTDGVREVAQALVTNDLRGFGGRSRGQVAA